MARGVTTPEARARERAKREAARVTAHRERLPWTAAELARVRSRTRLTDYELGAELGRSADAVSAKRYALGIRKQRSAALTDRHCLVDGCENFLPVHRLVACEGCAP